MQLLCCVAFLLLCILPFLSSVFPLKCNGQQYSWPVTEPKLCCEMCPPGEHMKKRPDNSCAGGCQPCEGERFTDTYNEAMTCKVCIDCTQGNKEYKARCNFTQNAECRCKTGYSCKDKSCTECEPIPTTTISTTEAFTTIKPKQPIAETVWFLVIIALLCIGIALVLLTKIKPVLRWIRSKESFLFADKSEHSYSEDDDQSKPVQEVCGECDQPIDVCVKC